MLSSESTDTDQRVIRMFPRVRIPEWVPQLVAMSTSRCKWDRVTEIMKNPAFHFDAVLGLLRDPETRTLDLLAAIHEHKTEYLKAVPPRNHCVCTFWSCTCI